MKSVYKLSLLSLLSAFLLFQGSILAQLPTVDIGIFQASPTQLEVRLKPDFSSAGVSSFDGLFSNLQFTIVWDASTGITLNNPTFIPSHNFYMYPLIINSSGGTKDVNGKRYQKFAGFGFATIGSTVVGSWQPGDEFVIAQIPVTNPNNAVDPIGSNWFSIGHDAETTDPAFNGIYYAELNSQDQTGICYASLNVLPVEMVSFEAKKLNEHDVELEWVTSSELNNDYFIIEKSKDGNVFNQIAKVEGQGTTTDETAYDYIDRSGMANVNYYRLKQVDFDGSFEYSDVVEVRFDLFENDKFVAFPSPTTDFATLRATGPLDGVYNYTLSDLRGNVLQKGKLDPSTFNGEVKIDLTDYAEGIYYIRTVSPRAKSYLNRVIKVNR